MSWPGFRLLRDTLELIRFEMGKPLATQSEAIVTNVHSHEAYFQALTLFHKADRLALELTGSTGIPPEPISLSALAPLHIWKMVNMSYLRILAIKEELGLKEIISERPEDSSTSLTETGRAIVQANRQINLLQERHFSPSDVAQQVLLASQYAKRLLARFPQPQVASEAPPLERGKQPADVFLRLVECYASLETIAHQSGIPVLHLDLPAAKSVGLSRQLEPSDVYDMATLLVSDLAYLQGQLKKIDLSKAYSLSGTPVPFSCLPASYRASASVEGTGTVSRNRSEMDLPIEHRLFLSIHFLHHPLVPTAYSHHTPSSNRGAFQNP